MNLPNMTVHRIGYRDISIIGGLQARYTNKILRQSFKLPLQGANRDGAHFVPMRCIGLGYSGLAALCNLPNMAGQRPTIKEPN